MDDVLTTADAAAELGISPNTLRIYCQQGRIGRKFGTHWLITRAELEAFKETRRPPGRPRKDEAAGEEDAGGADAGGETGQTDGDC